MENKIKEFLLDTELDTSDTRKIKTVYKILQTLNVIYAVLLVLVAFITMIVCMVGEAFGAAILTFIGILVVDAISFFITKLILNILFGFFYDIRKLRMLKENDAVTNSCENNEQA